MIFGSHRDHAPGKPGIPARWTSSAKTGVGTSLSQRLWFTLSHGIVNEVYYPRIDQAAIRDMGLIVGDGHSWVNEEKRHTTRQVDSIEEGVPAYRLTNTCKDNRYRIEKEIIADPTRPVLLQRVRFTPLTGTLRDYRLYAYVSPHLDNGGSHNTGWTDEHRGLDVLLASRDHSALALASSAPWVKRSVGYVGHSDGPLDLERHKRMKWEYARAEDGNICLTGEIDLQACGGEFLLVLGFGHAIAEACMHARAGLLNGFDDPLSTYVAEWKAWQSTLLPLDRNRKSDGKNCYRVATKVIRTHEATDFPGGIIASLSIPWGFSRGDGDMSGYHVAWPRDLVEAAGGLLAAGAFEDALRVLGFLEAVQEEDGHWAQCLWLDGAPYWTKIQMDETALPILLADLIFRENACLDPARYWPMIRRAALYLMTEGPSSPQDRWEEEAGYTPFTVAASIAALLAAASFSDLNSEPALAEYLRVTADAWHAGIDRGMYITGNDWCAEHGVQGYYNRITPNVGNPAHGKTHAILKLKNVTEDKAFFRADHLVSADALALVRFGLRKADDPRILGTVALIDKLLKVDTPNGPAWHRYNGDGYGEQEDGSAFKQTGIGRAWPLLAGERAHYALLAGATGQAEMLRNAMEAFANIGGMIPEQVWDSADVPERELFLGQASGSGNPLVWAHAEYLKLLRSLRDGAVFDMPRHTVERYINQQTVSRYEIWSFRHRIARIAPGKILRIQTNAAATIRWTNDFWTTAHDDLTTATGFGLHYLDVQPERIATDRPVTFTFLWRDADRWEGENFITQIAA